MEKRVEKFKSKVLKKYDLVNEATFDKFLEENKDSLFYVRDELISMQRAENYIDKHVVASLSKFVDSINSDKSTFNSLYNQVMKVKIKTSDRLKKSKSPKRDEQFKKDIKICRDAEVILNVIVKKREEIKKVIPSLKGLDKLTDSIAVVKKEIESLEKQIKAKEKLAKIPFGNFDEDLNRLYQQLDAKSKNLKTLLTRRSECYQDIYKTLECNSIAEFRKAYCQNLANIRKLFVEAPESSTISKVAIFQIDALVSRSMISSQSVFAKVEEREKDVNLITMNTGLAVKTVPVEEVKEPEKEPEVVEEEVEEIPYADVISTVVEEKPAKKAVDPKSVKDDDSSVATLLASKTDLDPELIEHLTKCESLEVYDYGVIIEFFKKNNCNGNEKYVINLYNLNRAGGLSDEILDDLLRTITHPKISLKKDIDTIPKTYKEFSNMYGISEDLSKELYRLNKSDIKFACSKMISQNMTLEEVKEMVSFMKEISEYKKETTKKASTSKSKKTTTKKATKAKEPAAKVSTEPVKDETPVIKDEVSVVENQPVTEEPIKAEEPKKEEVKEEAPVVEAQPVVEVPKEEPIKKDENPFVMGELKPVEEVAPAKDENPFVMGPVKDEPVVEAPSAPLNPFVMEPVKAEEPKEEPVHEGMDDSEYTEFSPVVITENPQPEPTPEPQAEEPILPDGICKVKEILEIPKELYLKAVEKVRAKLLNKNVYNVVDSAAENSEGRGR